jgi:thiamine-monophosphate kinase
MPSLDEFGLIARLFAPLAASHPGALGLTDDAALIDAGPSEQWAITMDALVAGVHFLGEDPPELIARKLVRVNLSDLAAMGAKPFAILLATCFPAGVAEDWVERFATGLKIDCEEFAIALIGGDTVATPGPLTLAVTALGRVPAGSALLRSNARSGDYIWVSGTIGDGAFGLDVAEGRLHHLEEAAKTWLLDRYRIPHPRLSLGWVLRGVATAAMDVSDGLVGDLGHICCASAVGAVVDATKIPLSPAAEAAIATGASIARVLSGGDDYELLFTAPVSVSGKLAELSASLGLRLTPIGQIIEGSGVTVIGADGRPLDLAKSGYKHFGG